MIAEPQYTPDRYERAVAAIHSLLDELGIGRRALFHEVGEGMAFPDGSESMSGGVIDDRGRVFMFWTGWDAARNRPVFITWRQIEPEAPLLVSREYQEARAAVGLGLLPSGVDQLPRRT